MSAAAVGIITITVPHTRLHRKLASEGVIVFGPLLTAILILIKFSAPENILPHVTIHEKSSYKN